VWSLLSILAYIPLQILCLPLALIGAAYVLYCQVFVSKRLGLSMTAVEVLNCRWGLHVFGIRPDPSSVKLTHALPNTSAVGLWLTFGPLWLKYKLCGDWFVYPRVPPPHQDDLRDLIVVRSLVFDQMIAEHLPHVEQFVILGAGYDTRALTALNAQSGGRALSVFEVDQPAVQQHKIENLQRAGIDAHDVHYVAVDFTRDNLFEYLSAAGFDRRKRTLFLCEGVTLYLSADAVRTTLREVVDNSPTGSLFLADIYADRFVHKLGGHKRVKPILDYTNEALDFSLNFSSMPEQALATFVTDTGLTVERSTFLGTQSPHGPYGCVVAMEVP